VKEIHEKILEKNNFENAKILDNLSKCLIYLGEFKDA
jgi:hypothetical protein